MAAESPNSGGAKEQEQPLLIREWSRNEAIPVVAQNFWACVYNVVKVILGAGMMVRSAQSN